MGLATARALSRGGRDVVVYEQFEPGHVRGSSHGRSRIFRHRRTRHAGALDLANAAVSN
jgi:sarcosine oxidase